MCTYPKMLKNLLKNQEKGVNIMSEIKINDDTLLGTLKDEDYEKLKRGIENRVCQKISNRIDDAKEKIMDDITGR